MSYSAASNEERFVVVHQCKHIADAHVPELHLLREFCAHRIEA